MARKTKQLGTSSSSPATPPTSDINALGTASATTSNRPEEPEGAASRTQNVNKATMTSFSDTELLRKVQFPLVQPPVDTSAITMSNGVPENARHTIVWRDITWSFPSARGIFAKLTDYDNQPRRKTAIKNVTGSAGPGEILGIIGPPNSGKSALLNVISGFCRVGYDGEVLVNGQRISNVDELSQRSCHVEQTDVHMGCFSVKETLCIAAELKYPTSTEQREKFKAVMNGMERWGLMDVRHTLVENISKTHKRLLTCAEQLINAQPIIFLDDPTRYLDASQARSCMRTLRHFAHQGHTVVAAASDPSMEIMRYFTKVCVLSEGRVIYYGEPRELQGALREQGFFCPPDASLAEFLLEVTAKMHGSLRALADNEAANAGAFLEAEKDRNNEPVAVAVEKAPEEEEEPSDHASRRRLGMANIYVGRVEVDSRDYLSVLFNRFIFFTFRSPKFCNKHHSLEESASTYLNSRGAAQEATLKKLQRHLSLYPPLIRLCISVSSPYK